MDEKNPLGTDPIPQPTKAPVTLTPTQPIQPAAAPQPTPAPTPQPVAPQDTPITPATAPLPPQGTPVTPPPPVQPTPAPAQPQANPFVTSQTNAPIPPQSPYDTNSYGQPQPPLNPRGDGAPSATGAIICGVLAIVFSWIPLAGLILGIVALVLASKFVRLHGRFGGSGAAKVCGIIGIVLSILWGILSAVVMTAVVGIMSSEEFSSKMDSIVAESNFDETSEAADMAAVQGILDQLEFEMQNPSDETLAQIAANADADFKDIFGYSMTELTIDPMNAANWLKEGIVFEYDPESDIIVFSDGTASAFISVTMHDSQVMADNMDAELNAMMDSNPAPASEAEKNALVADAFARALAASTDTTSYSAIVDLTKNGDTWEIDQESWQEELDYLFSFM